MGKLDVGVGDEFPVDEPAPPSPEDTDAVRAAREEWRQQKEEWRRGKAEWRQQRDAWKEDMRTRGRAFKADCGIASMNISADHTAFAGLAQQIRARVLVALALVALAIALLPFLFMFGFFDPGRRPLLRRIDTWSPPRCSARPPERLNQHISE